MFKKIFSIIFIFLFLSSISIAKDKIDETIDKTTNFLKSISKKSLNKSQTAEFLNNYAITLEDERNQGVVTYIFDEKNYKRYKDGKVISEDGWRFTNLGKLRVFSGDIKLTWKFKLDKQNVIVIKTKFQPIGKEYPFKYQLKEKFFEQINQMSKRYSGKSFKESSVMKKAKFSLKEKRKAKKEKRKSTNYLNQLLANILLII